MGILIMLVIGFFLAVILSWWGGPIALLVFFSVLPKSIQDTIFFLGSIGMTGMYYGCYHISKGKERSGDAGCFLILAGIWAIVVLAQLLLPLVIK